MDKPLYRVAEMKLCLLARPDLFASDLATVTLSLVGRGHDMLGMHSKFFLTDSGCHYMPEPYDERIR